MQANHHNTIANPDKSAEVRELAFSLARAKCNCLHDWSNFSFSSGVICMVVVILIVDHSMFKSTTNKKVCKLQSLDRHFHRDRLRGMYVSKTNNCLVVDDVRKQTSTSNFDLHPRIEVFSVDWIQSQFNPFIFVT